MSTPVSISSDKSIIENQELKEETIDIDLTTFSHENNLIDYKIIIYKFDKPLQKNIKSLQLSLSQNISPTNIYISLYSNYLQLTTPKQIYFNMPIEILDFTFLPSQFTPECQFRLLAHIDNTYKLNHVKNSSIELKDININMKIKYCFFDNVDLTSPITVFHNDDIRNLVVRNGNLFYLKRYI